MCFLFNSRLGFLLVAAALVAQAQTPIREPERLKLLDRVMAGKVDAQPLKCHVQTFRPFLDFAFRFEAGYVIRCPLAQFEGKETGIAAYLRIQPKNLGGEVKPIYLGETFRMPAIPEAMREHYAWSRLNQEAELSGVFAAGVGEYEVNLVMVDERQRVFRKEWRVKIEPGRSERKAEISLRPNTVVAAGLPPWHEGKPVRAGEGPQLTVLLDAAPIYPNSQKLRAWDRAFLLSSLASVLRGMQPSSVRLVAFNLEQQREVYHEERFDREHFGKLGEALSRLELGTVSYKTLGSQYGWADLLTGLVGRESKAGNPADAVVFIGPNVRNLTKIPRELIPCANVGSKLHYLEFFPIPGYEFPDTIHQLTNTCHGNVYRLHSPSDLADAILKLQNKVPAQQARVSAPAP